MDIGDTMGVNLRILEQVQYLAVYQSLRVGPKLFFKPNISPYITGYHGKSGTLLARG